MNKEEKAPQLTYECPKHWNSMSGSESERFCEVCQHTVHNLSLLSKSQRAELVANSKTERVCAFFHKDLTGNLITADSADELSRKVKAARLAAIAAGSIALASCGSTPDDIPLPGVICPPAEEGK